jgi:Fe-S-cluster containining protein
MKCIKCQKELPESEFYPSHIKNHMHTCKKCLKSRSKDWYVNSALREEAEKDFERYYGGIKINITNYPRAYEISKTSGEYYFTRNKEEFIKKLLDILK